MGQYLRNIGPLCLLTAALTDGRLNKMNWHSAVASAVGTLEILIRIWQIVHFQISQESDLFRNEEVLAEALCVPKDEFCLMVCLSLGSLSAVCLEMQTLRDVLHLAGGSSSRAAAMQLYCDINPLPFTGAS